MAWDPDSPRPVLAAASSDGRLTILEVTPTRNVNEQSNSGDSPPRFEWSSHSWPAHSMGALCCAFSPKTPPKNNNLPAVDGHDGDEKDDGLLVLASGGCDNLVKIWERPLNAPYTP